MKMVPYGDIEATDCKISSPRAFWEEKTIRKSSGIPRCSRKSQNTHVTEAEQRRDNCCKRFGEGLWAIPHKSSQDLLLWDFCRTMRDLSEE